MFTKGLLCAVGLSLSEKQLIRQKGGNYRGLGSQHDEEPRNKDYRVAMLETQGTVLYMAGKRWNPRKETDEDLMTGENGIRGRRKNR